LDDCKERCLQNSLRMGQRVNIRISAIICTLNRAQYLCRAIRSLAEQTLPKDQYEIVVVDNGSKDETKKIVHEATACGSNLRYIYEPILGLSSARNTGWLNAEGEYVAYLDDDAIASPQWLETILEVFEMVKPRPGCVGGKVDPVWEAPRPSWLSDAIVSYLTVVSWSDIPIALSGTQWLAGANMAFNKAMLASIGGFKSSLGRIGERLVSNEEIIVQKALIQKGYCCFYHPNVSVAHHIPASRLSKRWFLRRFFWQGVSDSWVKIAEECPSMLQRARIGFNIARKMSFSPRGVFCLIGSTNDPKAFELKCHNLAKVGYLLGLSGLVR
jgi:glucosyl-dolichyl phosphate glucuronosyltransferase